MSGDYLWDGTGEVDPALAELERRLEPLRYRGRPPRVGRDWRLWAGAAVLLAATLAAVVLGMRPDPPGWRVDASTGCPDDDCTLRVGEWVEMPAQARIEVADIGEMVVSAGSRLRVKRTGSDEHRLELARGEVSATVTAPPRLFLVETASATAVDLGCAYTLAVDDAGDGRLSVDVGWVALEAPGRSVEVPAGASARLASGRGPGTPWFTDHAAVEAALAGFEAGDGTIASVLAACTDVRDTLTLLYLLPVTSGGARARVFDRIEAVVPPGTALPPRSEVLALDAAALASLHDVLLGTW